MYEVNCRFKKGTTCTEPNCAARSLTCSWAASLWSPGHMRGNISTGRCARLSLGISETTTEAGTQGDNCYRNTSKCLIGTVNILQDNHPSGVIRICFFYKSMLKILCDHWWHIPSKGITRKSSF